MTTDLNYNQLLEWDKHDLIDQILGLQHELIKRDIKKINSIIDTTVKEVIIGERIKPILLEKLNELIKLYKQSAKQIAEYDRL